MFRYLPDQRKGSPGFVAVLLVAALWLHGCGTSNSDPETVPAGEAANAADDLVPLRVHMGFSFAGAQYYAKYLVGLEQGFYADEGLDVEFIDGSGSATTAQLVANSSSDLGAAVASGAVIRARTEGAPVKMVARTTPANPLGFVSRADAPIHSPADLRGKVVAVPVGAEPEQILPAFLHLNDLDEDDIEVLSLDGAQLQQALAGSRVDAYAAYVIGMPRLEHSFDVKPTAMLWSDYGISYEPGEGIVASETMIEEKPEIIRSFLRAVERSFRFAHENPGAAAEAAARQRDEIDEKVAEAELQVLFPLMDPMLQSDSGMFAMEASQWQTTVELLEDYAGLAGSPAADTFFTNELLP